MAFREEFSERWEGERPDAGNSNLAAVGVSGEDKVDERAAAVVGDVDGVVRLMDHEDDGSVGFLGDGYGQIGLAVGVVVETAEKDMLSLALDADELVYEHREAVVFHVVPNDAAAYGCVVISKDAEPLRASQFAEELAAETGCGV